MSPGLKRLAPNEALKASKHTKDHHTTYGTQGTFSYPRPHHTEQRMASTMLSASVTVAPATVTVRTIVSLSIKFNYQINKEKDPNEINIQT